MGVLSETGPAANAKMPVVESHSTLPKQRSSSSNEKAERMGVPSETGPAADANMPVAESRGTEPEQHSSSSNEKAGRMSVPSETGPAADANMPVVGSHGTVPEQCSSSSRCQKAHSIGLLSSSSSQKADNIGLPSETEPAGDARMPVVEGSGIQEPSLQMDDGSSLAEFVARLIEETTVKVNGVPLPKYTLRHPLEAWRIWNQTHPRDYTEKSPEFKERLRIFRRNAKTITARNAELKMELLVLNNLADQRLCEEGPGVLPSGPPAVLPGTILPYYEACQRIGEGA